MNNLPAGTVLGQYRLIKLLGRGGFADVYLGKHQMLDSYAAIKVLYKVDEQEIRKFLEEARTLVRLRHPHIVQIHDFGVTADAPYLIMQYVPGGSLSEVYRRETPLPPILIVAYVKQIASALQYAHDRRVIHCDVNPRNMFLDPDTGVLLGDFGIALTLKSSTMPTQEEIRGTVTYMAPEQFKGNPSPASDQYSLAVVVYQWLCGEPPFQGRNFFELQNQHAHSKPPSLSKKVPGLHPSIEVVVNRALEKDPDRRFDSIQHFADALEQAFYNHVYQPSVPLAPRQEKAVLIAPDAGNVPVASRPSHQVKTAHSSKPDPQMPSQRSLSRDPFGPLTKFFVSLKNPFFNSIRRFWLPTAIILIAISLFASGALLHWPIRFATAQGGITATPGSQANSDPYPPYIGTLAFSDSLINNNEGNGWKTYSDALSSCEFVNAHYQIVETKTSYYADCQSTSYFSNFTAQVQMQIVKGDCGGMVFRADPTLTQFYLFRICQDGTYDLLNYIDNTNAHAHTLAHGKSSNIRTGTGAINVIGLVANHGQISLYANGKYITAAIDSSYAEGHIALFAQSEGKTTEVDFSNLKVWNL